MNKFNIQIKYFNIEIQFFECLLQKAECPENEKTYFG